MVVAVTKKANQELRNSIIGVRVGRQIVTKIVLSLGRVAAPIKVSCLTSTPLGVKGSTTSSISTFVAV